MLLPDDPDFVVYRRGQVVVVLNMSDHERVVPDHLIDGLRVLAASGASSMPAPTPWDRMRPCGSGRDV